ncbi:MAG: cell division protein SepF [Eubacterium sp.]|jgi:cell division inhibitor SepF
MGFTDSLKKVIGIEDVDDDEIVTEEELAEAKKKIAKDAERTSKATSDDILKSNETKDAAPLQTPSFVGASTSPFTGTTVKTPSTSTEKRFSVTSTNSLKLILIEPKGFQECPKLVDSLKARKPVIINLEKLETETARKIFDFLSGATYALNGNVQKIANNIFIFTPENVSVFSQQATRDTAAEPEEKNPWR